MSGYADLGPGETVLQGALAGEVTGEPDDVESRIRWLVAHRLRALASSASGWDWLFEDPLDGRLWEQSFPLGSLHGPGPRRLAVISAEAARAAYGHTGDGSSRNATDGETPRTQGN